MTTLALWLALSLVVGPIAGRCFHAGMVDQQTPQESP